MPVSATVTASEFAPRVATLMEVPLPNAEASAPTAEGMGKLRSAPLYINAAAAVELVFVFQPFIGQAGDLDGAWLAKGFETAGEVDGVAPKVVGEFPAPNDAGHDGAGAEIGRASCRERV